MNASIPPLGVDLSLHRLERLDLALLCLEGRDFLLERSSPLVRDAVVRATVEEQGYGKKVIVFKKKRRKGYRRWRGYRARLSLLRINSIELPPDLEAAMSSGLG